MSFGADINHIAPVFIASPVCGGGVGPSETEGGKQAPAYYRYPASIFTEYA